MKTLYVPSLLLLFSFLSAGGCAKARDELTPGDGQEAAPAAPPSVSLLDAHPVLTDRTARVRILLSHAFSTNVTVDFETRDDSARGDLTGSGDYKPPRKTVLFPSGQTAAQVEIEVRTPYVKLTLETALDRRFRTRISNPTGGAVLARADGVVTLAHAGMVIETPLARGLSDGDVIPDFDADKAADLILTGRGGAAAVLLSTRTRFEEAAHVVADAAYLDGARGFSYPVDVKQASGIVAGDQSIPADFNRDGLSDLLVVTEGTASVLYGHAPPFTSFTPGDARLADGVNATRLTDIFFGYGASELQTGDWDGDGIRDWAQANYYSSVAGGSDRFNGFYGSAGPRPAVLTTPPGQSFSMRSGTTPVGQGSRSNGAIAGTTVDLNGDRIDDIVFSGLAANDGQFGGNFLYVKFSSPKRLTGQDAPIVGTLDGRNGFQIANDNYFGGSYGFAPQDGGDVNGDGLDDLIVLGGGVPLTVIFGKKTPFLSGRYARIQDLGSEAAFFDTERPRSARCGDFNHDGITDIAFITENKLRIVWGQPGLAGKVIRGTRYPEVGELDIDPASGLNDVSMVGDLDGDGLADIVLLSASHKGNTGGALVLFGRTLTPLLGGPVAPIG